MFYTFVDFKVVDRKQSVDGQLKYTGQRLLTEHTNTPWPCVDTKLSGNASSIGSNEGLSSWWE